ncbi:MAG TPA: fused MFS/spermidine synthase, partial [Clostridia bacterium]|nr:fused MFS/spermidine synthase [Clostridia bacterium]
GTYDLVILDAYVQGRYGSSLPQHPATKEFFELVKYHLGTNGIVAYNVIGSQTGYRASLVGSVYRTLKSVFPQVYAFPARTSQNIVLIATRAGIQAHPVALRQRAAALVQTRRLTLPGFMDRLNSMQITPPPNLDLCPILSDDYAPVEGLAAQN